MRRAPARNAAVVIGALLATPYLQDYDLVVGAFVVAWLTVGGRDQAGHADRVRR